MKPVKLKDAPKPENLFYMDTRLKNPDQIIAISKKIDARSAEMKKRRADAETKYKAVKAISKELNGDLKNILKRIADAELSIQGYITGLQSMESYLSEGAKSGEVTLRRIKDHMKALENMYKQWEKAEAAGDPRKSEIAGKAYLKAASNASKDFSLVGIYLEQAEDSVARMDKWSDSDFDANIKTLKEALQAFLKAEASTSMYFENIENKIEQKTRFLEDVAREKARWRRFM